MAPILFCVKRLNTAIIFVSIPNFLQRCKELFSNKHFYFRRLGMIAIRIDLKIRIVFI
jgi:hypothetical protein